jgi:energy-coupling factor transporter ATP-binding protein EcfA2
MSQPQVVIESGQRVVAVGKTGSGKSYLMRYLVKQLHRVMVLDPKSMIDPEQWNLDWASVRGVRDLGRGKNARLLVRGINLEDWAYWLQAAWDVGNVVVYIDELYALVDFGQGKPPRILSRLYTQGREKEVGVWGATQRPAWVPMFTLSESDWFFAFRTQLSEDRKRLAELMGEEVLEPVPDKHGFWEYNTEWDTPLYVPRLEVKVPANEREIQAREKVAQ